MDEDRRRQIEEEEAYRLQLRQAAETKTHPGITLVPDTRTDHTLRNGQSAQPTRDLPQSVGLSEDRRHQILEEERYRNQIRSELGSGSSSSVGSERSSTGTSQAANHQGKVVSYPNSQGRPKYSTGIWASIFCPGSGMLWIGVANWFFVYFLLYTTSLNIIVNFTIRSEYENSTPYGIIGLFSIVNLIIYVVQFFHYTAAYRQRFPTR